MNKKVTFNKLVGIIYLLCSLFILFLTLIEPSSSIVVGAFLVILSLLFLFMPVIVYNDDEMHVRNLIGMTTKVYFFSKDNLSIRNGRIHTHSYRIKMPTYLFSPREFRELKAFIQNKENDSSHSAGSKTLISDSDILDA